MSAREVEREPPALSRGLVERVLESLGLRAVPDADLEGLRELYAAWCAHVPFDNVRKLLHLRSGQEGRLPGDDPAEFLEHWLRHGVGGTCWAGNGALQALLRAMGFEADRGLATMLSSPGAPPNHGTVVVSLQSRRFIVDASILHGAPLELAAAGESSIDHPAWGVLCRRQQDRWHIRWRPLHMCSGFDCRIEQLQMSAAGFQQLHEAARNRSPFNYSLYVRANRGQSTLGIAFGQQVELSGQGGVSQRPIAEAERIEWLVEHIGIDPTLLAQLPPDLPLPSAPR